MEYLNLFGLLLIAATNVYIGLMVRAQSQNNNISVNVPAPEMTVELTSAAPTVITKIVPDQLDYGRLEELLRGLIIEATSVPSVLPPPTWQNPVLADGTQPISIDTGHSPDVFTINGIPAKQFPNRT